MNSSTLKMEEAMAEETVTQNSLIILGIISRKMVNLHCCWLLEPAHATALIQKLATEHPNEPV